MITRLYSRLIPNSETARKAMQRELQQPKVLVIDEIGYLPFDAVQASLLFQVICRRYQRGQPLILTSNKAFGDWDRCSATIR